MVFALLWLAFAAAPTTADITAPQRQFFESQIRPLLAKHCYSCHSADADSVQAGIRLDSRAGLVRGGDSGPAVVPGDAGQSLLIKAVRYESFEMPPKGKLSGEQIKALAEWVDMGAPWPDEPAPDAIDADAIGVEQQFDLEARRDAHWAWQPITDPEPPAVDRVSWPRQPLDRFVLAELERRGLEPARQADRVALVRRLYFDLIGLPPTPQELRDALRDDHPAAWPRLVDRLLASPHFGERWGRHWLDLVRYAESRGHEFDADARNAFQYRDYVIRALNSDVPYDQFVREHIAGDLLPNPRLNLSEGFNESVLGTGFWFLGEWVHSPVEIRKDETDRFDNMIDVMSKTFLAMTVACARCHDHKFDAISSADYYALSGFLQSSDYRQVRFESDHINRRVASHLAELDQEFHDRIRPVIAEALADAADALADAEHDSPQPSRWVTTKGKTSRRGRHLNAAVQPDLVLLDYGQLPKSSFLQNGVIFGDGPNEAGDLYLQTDDGGVSVALRVHSAAANDPFWHGLVGNSGGVRNQRGRLEQLPRSGRTLRTPTFTLPSSTLSCEVRGSGHVVACVDSHRLIAGPLHGETVVRIEPNQAGSIRWVPLSLGRYQGHDIHLEFTPARNATLEVFRVVAGAPPGSAESTDEGTSAPPADRADPLLLKRAVRHWKRGELADRPNPERLARTINAALRAESDWLDAAVGDGTTVRQCLHQWARQRRKLQDDRKLESALAMGMLDGSGQDDHLLIRGDSGNPGVLVRRRFLTAVDGPAPLAIASGSGRLLLAQRINARDNPLTRRAIVNRVWHHLFGRGIVESTDDFGVLGSRPSHPQLLDHLATRFDGTGQSLKQLVRYVCISAAYQMSCQVQREATALDPDNISWHHMPPRRLEAETIRDAMLVASGELRRQFYGPSVPVHLTSFMSGRGRPSDSGPLDGDGRRSIYGEVRRNFLSPFMLAFDAPVPFSTMGRRNVSNVPAQSLILMNDPFVIDRAAQCGRRVVQEGGDDVASRVTWLYRVCLARDPIAAELNVARQFIDRQLTRSEASFDESDLWAGLAHCLLMTKEFVYLR